MAIRTNDAAVKAVLLKDYDKKNKPDLTPFIRTANILTNRLNTTATNADTPIETDELLEIETWLAAHFYCVPDQPYIYKTTKGSQGQFQGKTDMYLEGTKYGQTAVLLDHTGILARLANGENIEASTSNATPGGFWLGKKPSEQTPYYDRS